MAYYIDLFSPETHEAFSRSRREVSGFAPRLASKAARVQVGDIFVCYVTRLSRWCGLLRVESLQFSDTTPIFVPENDPYSLRFRVRELLWLDLEHSVPIHDPSIWDRLSFTRGNSAGWTGKLRTSLTKIDDADGLLLADRLKSQAQTPKPFPYSDDDRRKLRTNLISRADGMISVSVPEASDDTAKQAPESRESVRLQALLARIGKLMGFQIWLPRNDRGAVERELKSQMPPVLDRLPLNYDDTTLRTIEQIDVLWLKGRSIVRAFEVEHTTSIYSGILRMADLLALQPNMEINLHIVAPVERREMVFREIKRPIFSLIEGRPLASCCTYLSYDSLRELSSNPHLSHMSDSVLEEYAEEAE